MLTSDESDKALAAMRSGTAKNKGPIPVTELPPEFLALAKNARARYMREAAAAGVVVRLTRDLDPFAQQLDVCHQLVHEGKARFIQPSDDPETWSIEPFQFKQRHEAAPVEGHSKVFHPDPKTRERPWIKEAAENHRRKQAEKGE